MGSMPSELRLDVRPTYVPKTISDFLGELTAIDSISERLLRFDEFLKRLEEEMRKIDAFKRELPLCMLLLNDAIVTLKEESVKCRTKNVEPVLEEFIPLKKKYDEDEKREDKKEMDSRDKKNWMSSVQLWNNDDHKTIDFKFDQKQNSVSHFVKGTGQDCPLVSNDLFQTSKNRIRSRAFMPFKGCSDFPAMVTKKREKLDVPLAGLSLLTPGLQNQIEEVSTNCLSSKISASRSGSSTTPTGNSNLRPGPQPSQHQTSRKQRRCWSPELHRRFVNALQQLGGSQVATPKQIRELMQVDGLTNDEVKSHLQKYRLHTRRLPTANTASANDSMVVLGGLWMSQEQHHESSKQSSSQSGSPTGPFQLSGTGGGTSTTCGDSMEDEEEEDDEKSQSFNWKSHIQRTGKVDV